jgi:capsular exopolysaccharide synthesis family protein
MTNDSFRSAPSRDSEPWNVVAALRQRWWVVVLAVIVAGVAGLVGGSQRTEKFEASAEILVVPYTQQDPELASIRMVRQSNEGERDLETATALLTSRRSAQVVANALNGRVTADEVESAVTLEPTGGSNIIAVKAKLPDAALAVQVADRYANAAIAQRNAEVSAQARAQIEAIDGIQNDSLNPVRQQLRVLRNDGDPTVHVSQYATLPTSPAGPSNTVIVLAAIVAGFVIGVIGAVLLHRGDRRVKDRSQLLQRVPAPVLVGIPPSQRGHSGIDMPPAVREAFRTLQIQLDLREHEECRRILITSASSGDGKTTTVLNLAFALVSAGHRVLVIDFDLRKPDIGRQLDVRDPVSLVTTLATGEPLTAIMRPAPRLPPMRVVQVSTGPGDVAMLPMLTRRMQTVLEEATDLADYVLIDTAPIGEVSDALPLIEHVDDVLVVGRPGATDGRSLETMSGLFERAGVHPLGWIITGAETSASSYYMDDAGRRGVRGLFSRRPAAPSGR